MEATAEILKLCPKCSEMKPATPEYFHRDKARKDGLTSYCKVCVLKYHHDTSEARIANTRRWQKEHEEQHKQYQREYKVRNKEKVRAWQRNSQRRQRVGQLLGADEGSGSAIWLDGKRQKTNHQLRRYRRRKYNWPFDFTQADVDFALEYWHGCCAVCGKPLRDLFDERRSSMDHWIPLSARQLDNPGTVPQNMIPLCHGVNGCNNRKYDRDPGEWLVAEYGKRKAGQIIERISAFFAIVRHSNGQWGDYQI